MERCHQPGRSRGAQSTLSRHSSTKTQWTASTLWPACAIGRMLCGEDAAGTAWWPVNHRLFGRCTDMQGQGRAARCGGPYSYHSAACLLKPITPWPPFCSPSTASPLCILAMHGFGGTACPQAGTDSWVTGASMNRSFMLVASTRYCTLSAGFMV
jgi:hypothetical protein